MEAPVSHKRCPKLEGFYEGPVGSQHIKLAQTIPAGPRFSAALVRNKQKLSSSETQVARAFHRS